MGFLPDPLPFEVYGVTPLQHYLMFFTTLSALILNLVIARLMSLTQRESPQEKTPRKTPAELLVVLGSGGHTAEILNILGQVKGLQSDYNRAYIVSSGDGFSAAKASEFEKALSAAASSATASGKGKKAASKTSASTNDNYQIHTVKRARRVHQSFFTAPFTSLLCLYDCVRILLANPPDLIITNGPGTGVCVVLASVLLRMFLWGRKGREMRTTFIESWARVKTLSLSGRILIYFVDRFVVQWPALVREIGEGSVEYRGPLVR